MTDQLRNQMRLEAHKVLSGVKLPCAAIVDSYNPNSYCAKVRLQPDNVLTGWIPVRTDWSGNGWGLFCPPSAGDEVEVQFQEGGLQAPYIAGRFYSSAHRPLAVPSGEWWLVHKNGQFIKLLNDGTIASHGTWNHSGNVFVTGNITATGDIIDQSGTNSATINNLRTTYDIHTHNDPQGGATATPNQTV